MNGRFVCFIMFYYFLSSMSYELLSYEFCSEDETETEADLLSTEY